MGRRATWVSMPSNQRVERDQLVSTARGIIAETHDYRTGAGTLALGATGASNTLQASLVGLKQGDTITNVVCYMSNVGATVSLFKMALFDKNANLLRATVDKSGALGSNGAYLAGALTSPYTITTSDAYYLAVLTIAAVTVPTIGRGSQITGLGTVIGTGLRSCFQVAAQTDITGTVTPADTINAVWLAVS